eukprot:14839992-Heterocapsa_arctica.AAC.1
MVALMAMAFQNGTVASTGPEMWLPPAGKGGCTADPVGNKRGLEADHHEHVEQTVDIEVPIEKVVEAPVPRTQEEIFHVPKTITQERITQICWTSS